MIPCPKFLAQWLLIKASTIYKITTHKEILNHQLNGMDYVSLVIILPWVCNINIPHEERESAIKTTHFYCLPAPIYNKNV